MRVVLVTGSYPPDICGVSDYTARLRESLLRAGVYVDVLTGRRWGLRNVASIMDELLAIDADVLHMQYPATGYGWKLGPQLMSLLRPFVMTIHECSRSHFLRKVSLYPFSLRAPKIIFTNEFEQNYACHFAPWIKGRSAIIPIGNNVSLISGDVNHLTNVVTYFGIIRPQKGLDQVVTMARLFKARKSGLSVRIVGTVMPGYENYYRHLRCETQGLPVEWVLDLNGENLSSALAETDVAYLPFPDGASERRGSLIAMMSNGATVLTTRGPHTPSAMERAVVIANSADEAVVLAENLYRKPSQRHVLQKMAVSYARRFSWNEIAAEHLSIYQQVLDRK